MSHPVPTYDPDNSYPDDIITDEDRLEKIMQNCKEEEERLFREASLYPSLDLEEDVCER